MQYTFMFSLGFKTHQATLSNFCATGIKLLFSQKRLTRPTTHLPTHPPTHEGSKHPSIRKNGPCHSGMPETRMHQSSAGHTTQVGNERIPFQPCLPQLSASSPKHLHQQVSTWSCTAHNLVQVLACDTVQTLLTTCISWGRRCQDMTHLKTSKDKQ